MFLNNQNKQSRLEKLLAQAYFEKIRVQIAPAIINVIRSLKQRGIKWRVTQVQGWNIKEGVGIEFSVRKPLRFTFWNCIGSDAGDNSSYYIKPPYFPKGERGLMINGDTDAYIAGDAVPYIYCPAEARQSIQGFSMSSWSYVTHPYKADGQTLQMTLHLAQFKTETGQAELRKILAESLGISERYASVSGGFSPPIVSAHNILFQRQLPSPWPKASRSSPVRGSEDSCVWQYRALEKEGLLGHAKIPQWFKQEGWLDIYRNVQLGTDCCGKKLAADA